MNYPLVTIIMPVYNAKSVVGAAIRSVLEQDHTNWELLVINDGSTDDSLLAINAFNDDRIKVISQKNCGVSAARNSALNIMRGNFFCFLDADDVLSPNSLSLRLSCFTDSQVHFADGSVMIFDASMTQCVGRWMPQPTCSPLKSLVRLDGKCFFGPTWMIRRDPTVCYKFDENLTHGEDLFFYMCYAHLGKYAYTGGVVLNYRKSSSSAMNNINGLAKGYSYIKSRINFLPSAVSLGDRVIFDYRIRKIIFLSFIRSRKPWSAFRYLLQGSL